jgi:glycerol-3-phosphate acyltransferase PlsY
MLPYLSLLLILLLSYLLGSTPTSILAGRIASGVDIRQHGSGNAGATNVYRVLGLKWAVAVALIDVAKGTVAALVVSRIDLGGNALLSVDLTRLVAGGAAVAGHVWTVFAGFKGGKGVATAVGALLGIAPAAIGAVLGVWVILLFTVRIMSVASLGAAAVLPFAVWIWQGSPDGGTPHDLFWASVVMAAFIFFTHRSNIARLLRGEERTLRAPGSAHPRETPKSGSQSAGPSS